MRRCQLQKVSGTNLWHCPVCDRFLPVAPDPPPLCYGPLTPPSGPPADEAEVARRLAICSDCPYFRDAMCRICSCGTPSRITWDRILRDANALCPIGRWHQDAAPPTPARPKTRDRVYVIGYPGPVGGADTECWHTVRLWREQLGLRVCLVPTWAENPRYRAKLDAIGAETVRVAGLQQLGTLPVLDRSVVVGFCNRHFLDAAQVLREHGAALVWVGCMTWVFPAERQVWAKIGLPEAVVFQSDYQRGLVEPQLRQYGRVNAYRIRGAFSPDEFPFQPAARTSGGPMTVCRIARADADKWHQDLWRILEVVPEVSFIGLGWRPNVEQRVGPPPSWARVYPPGTVPVREVLGQSHVMLCVNSKARENWPQSALEAMASGVAVIAERRWGWLEMIQDGQTGILTDTPQEATEALLRLRADERYRLRIITQARAWIEAYIQREGVAEGWARLFAALGLPSQP